MRRGTQGTLSTITCFLHRNQKMRCFPSPAPSTGLSCNLNYAPPMPSCHTGGHHYLSGSETQSPATPEMGIHVDTPLLHTPTPPHQIYQHLSTRDIQHTTRSEVPTLSTPSRPTPHLTPLKPQEHFGLLCQLRKNTATFRIHTYLVLNLLD